MCACMYELVLIMNKLNGYHRVHVITRSRKLGFFCVLNFLVSVGDEYKFVTAVFDNFVGN